MFPAFRVARVSLMQSTRSRVAPCIARCVRLSWLCDAHHRGGRRRLAAMVAGGGGVAHDHQPPPHGRDIAGGVIAVLLGVLVLLGAGGGFLALAALRGSGDAAGDGIYVSLGDSIAAGNGASDPRQTGSSRCWPSGRMSASTFNVAVAGATTQDVIDVQVAKVLSIVQAGHVSFITISAGGNDLAALIPNAACTQDPLPARARSMRRWTASKRGSTRSCGICAMRTCVCRSCCWRIRTSSRGRGTSSTRRRRACCRGSTMSSPALRRSTSGWRWRNRRRRSNGAGGELTGVLAEPFDPHPNDEGTASSRMRSRMRSIGRESESI